MAQAAAPKSPPWFGPLLRLLVTAACLGLLLGLVDVRESWRFLREAQGTLGLGALGCYLASLAVTAWRWQLMLRHDGWPAPWGSAAGWYLESCFYGLLLPSGVGGDLFRGLQARDRLGGTRRAVVNVVAERLVGLGSVCLLGLGGMLVWGSDPTLRAALGAAYGLVLALTLLLTRPRAQAVVAAMLRRLGWTRGAERYGAAAAQFAGYLGSPRLLAYLLALSLLQQALAVGGAWLAASAAGVTLGPGFYFLAMPLVWLASLAPALAGAGPREGALVYLLVQAGVSAPQATAAAGLLLSVHVARGLLGGILALRRALAPRREAEGAGDVPG